MESNKRHILKGKPLFCVNYCHAIHDATYSQRPKFWIYWHQFFLFYDSTYIITKNLCLISLSFS